MIAGFNGISTDWNFQNQVAKLTCIHDWEGLHFTDDSYAHFYGARNLTGVPTEMLNVPASGSVRQTFGGGNTGLGVALTSNNMVSGWDMSRVKAAEHLFQEIGYYANQNGLVVDFSVSDWDVSNICLLYTSPSPRD